MKHKKEWHTCESCRVEITEDNVFTFEKKTIIVITDSAKIADFEFKSLCKRLADKGIFVKAEESDRILYTKNWTISFWDAYSEWYRLIVTSNNIGYSNCHIGSWQIAPLIKQSRMWHRIESLIETLPEEAKEIPYTDIERMVCEECLKQNQCKK